MESLFLLLAAVTAWCSVTIRQYHVVYEPMTQAEARSYCREHYVDLATLENMEDVHTLNNMVDMSRLQGPSGYHHRRAWIGLYSDITSWVWSLSDPSYYSEGQADYRAWSDGEPDNKGGKELCVCMSDIGEWVDRGCDEYFGAICVHRDGDSETFVQTTETFSWEGAQQYCRSHYTDLASVRNAQENQMLTALIDGQRLVWIGLQRSPWSWQDGNNLTLSHWRTQDGVEPNNNGGDEYCVAANFELDGTWEDWPCSSRKGFICYRWPVRKYNLKLKLQTSYNDPNEPALTGAVLDQLKRHIQKANVKEPLTLRWAEDADGNVLTKN